MLNKAQLIGHLGSDPKIINTEKGKFAAFSIATTETWKDKQTGEKKEHTDWHNIVVSSNGMADIVEKYLHKGSQVYIEGRLRTRTYDDNAGVKRYVTEIVVGGFNSDLKLLGKKESATPEAEPAPEPAPTDLRNLDDEIPF